ncbi:HD domain-containing protein [Empedobacter falsenii]
MKENLSKIFIELCSKYSNNKTLIIEYWKEIEESYSQKSRHYHNLSHLDNMIIELRNVYNEIQDFDSILFSIFFHDIFYKSTSKDNEEKSAELAKIRLQKLNFSDELINKIYNQILSTKSHQESNQIDTNFLLDADLSILGKNINEYETYIKQIRKEYSVYPDFLYNPGRKKVLKHFLTLDTIYKTEYFRKKYEKQARENIIKEIESL